MNDELFNATQPFLIAETLKTKETKKKEENFVPALFSAICCILLSSLQKLLNNKIR